MYRIGLRLEHITICALPTFLHFLKRPLAWCIQGDVRLVSFFAAFSAVVALFVVVPHEFKNSFIIIKIPQKYGFVW
jgi:hypothetical protein